MVDAAANMALETLRDLFIEEVKFLSDVLEGQVVDVGRDLQKMHRFLKDADKWQERYNSAIVRGWVSDLIDLATRAEDVLEKYAVEVTSKRVVNNLKEMLNRFIGILGESSAFQQMGEVASGIMSRMAKLTKDLEFIRNGEEYLSSIECNDEDQRLQRQTYGHGIEEHFVGMQNDIYSIISCMQVYDRPSYRVISICGMGDLGKTTLARKIYQHKFVLRYFERRAWVCVTQKLQAKDILQDILSQLLPGQSNEGTEETDELVRKLYDIQKKKKCLVVLDDIWEIDHWDILKKAFPLTESNSKILLTTRNQRIAETAEFVHKLDFLTEDESWDLLQKIALPIFHESDQENSKQFEAIGRELVNKCGRLPLTVSVIGGILRGQRYLGDWKKVLENLDSHLMKHGKGVNSNDKRVERVLDMSYNVLPYYLKLCFLYLVCFGEDEDIDVEDVYMIWLAEGLISSEDKGQNETLWDVAERYLNELASKCLVHVKLVTHTFESSKSCRIHALVRALCLSKGKEEKFFEDSQGKIRRLLAINVVDDDACSVSQFKNANLRSIVLISNERRYLDITKIWENLLSNNTLLRSVKVLVLEYCTFADGKLPDFVRKLVMLKHLSIRNTYISKVPEFVCKLPCLQSMDLRSGTRTELPNSINMMRRLRHLFIYPRRSLVMYPYITDIGIERPRLDGLTELETLIGFDSKYCHTTHLLKLTNLRSFGGCFYDIESLSVVADHFTKLKDQLREARLEIYASDLSSEQGSHVIDLLMHFPLIDLAIEGPLRRLPTWDPQLLHNLQTLRLSNSTILDDPMGTLQHLPALVRLSLDKYAFVGTEMFCGSGGFPQLKSLTLGYLSNLEEWRVEQGAMPNLSDLTIISCQRLKMIPEGLVFMASITELRILSMPCNFMKRLGRGGEDNHKISHIPHIRFT